MRAPPSARSLAPDLPSLLDHLFAKALRKDPRERYASADTLSDDWGFLMKE
jgi:hypothetical protein